MRRQLCAIALAMVFLITGAGAAPPLDEHSPFENKIDSRVLEDTADGQSTHFLVVLRTQADVRRAAAGGRDRQARGRLIYRALRQAAESSQPALIAQLQTLGAHYRSYWIVNMIAVEGDRSTVMALAARREASFIESNRTFRISLESTEVTSNQEPQARPLAASAPQWNLSWVHAPDVWALGYSGQGMVYANADTGVQWEHPALVNQYRGWDGATADHNYNWWDAIHEDLSGDGGNPCGFSSPQPCDDAGHGTHTLGIGVGDDGEAHQIGMAPGARWIGCRNMDSGVGRPETYIECMQFFLAPTDLDGQSPNPDLRPDAVGNSYACPPFELCAAHSLQTAMENLRAAGVFLVASAGNSGPACATISNPPGLEDSAITVGATENQSDAIASWSSRGPVTVDSSNRRKPDLVAPGANVLSSYPSNTYTSLSGTSMAAPHVAGAAALLWSAFPNLRGDVDGIENALEQTARHLTISQGCGGDDPEDVPNNVYGYGQLDVLAAYEYLASPTPLPTPTSTLVPQWFYYLPLWERFAP